jgi:hypothetical protein
MISERTLPDGRLATVIPLTLGRARLTVARDPRSFAYDDVW